MGVLGKVTGDLEAARGPDVKMNVSVRTDWFGSEIIVTVPRNLRCAACGGGGCDLCDRSGALSLRERGAEAETITVTLPREFDRNKDLCLRIPEQGAHPTDSTLGRGHLLLTVSPSVESSEGVVLAGPPKSLSAAERQQLMKSSVIMAVVLILLFFGMLRLSGWM